MRKYFFLNVSLQAKVQCGKRKSSSRNVCLFWERLLTIYKRTVCKLSNLYNKFSRYYGTTWKPTTNGISVLYRPSSLRWFWFTDFVIFKTRGLEHRAWNIHKNWDSLIAWVEVKQIAQPYPILPKPIASMALIFGINLIYYTLGVVGLHFTSKCGSSMVRISTVINGL